VLEPTSQKNATSDENGSYELAGLMARSIAVYASKPGYVTSMKTVEIGRDARLDIQLDRAPMVVKGHVYDTAERALSGATVEVLDGPQAGLSTTTTNAGEFSLTGTFDDSTRFRAAAEGHIPAVGTLNPPCQLCNPQRWMFFALDVLAAPLDLAGNYALNFVADSSCTGLPDEVRTRTYAATVTPAPSRPRTLFEVQVSGASFFEGYSGFWMSVAGDYVTFTLGDLHGRPGLVEQVARNSFLALEGWGAATVDASGPPISLTYVGVVEFCEMTSEVGSYEICASAKRVANARCASSGHQLVLTRR
jgi:hypothetical protein